LIRSNKREKNNMNKYGFYDRLTKAFPSQIIVDVCQVCNYECVHCPQSQFKNSDAFSGAYLSEDLNKKMVDEVAEFGKNMTQQIRYTAAGEPFLHPQIMDMLGYAVKNSGTFVSVTTNGSLLNDDIIEKLLEMNIGLVDFSLDALNDDTYSKIRKNGNLVAVRDNVLKMLEMRAKMNSSTRVVVSFVKQEHNIPEMDEFKRFWEEKGVDYVVLRMLHSAGGFFSENASNSMAYVPCVYPWERIKLTPTGDLCFCGFSWLEKRTIHQGYNTATIHDVWTGDDYSVLRDENLSGTFNRFSVCKECSDKYQTIWPANKTESLRGYGDMIKDFADNDK